MRRAPTWPRCAPARRGRCGSATYQSISARVLPVVMRRFMGDWPGIAFELSEPSNDETLYRGHRERRDRPRLLQPPRPGRPVRRDRAAHRSSRAPRLERQPARGARQRLARRPRRRADDRRQPVLERQRRRGCAARARRADRLRVPLRRQHDPAGPRRGAVRRRLDAAARGPAGRRPRQGDRARSAGPPPPPRRRLASRPAPLARRRARSSRSPARSAPRSSGVSSGRRPVVRRSTRGRVDTCTQDDDDGRTSAAARNVRSGEGSGDESPGSDDGGVGDSDGCAARSSASAGRRAPSIALEPSPNKDERLPPARGASAG